MTQDQERLFHDKNPTVDAVLDLLGEWVGDESRSACAAGGSDSERAHSCGRADALCDFRDRVLELRKQTRKIE